MVMLNKKCLILVTFLLCFQPLDGMAFRTIAQRAFSRVLTTSKSVVKKAQKVAKSPQFVALKRPLLAGAVAATAYGAYQNALKSKLHAHWVPGVPISHDDIRNCKAKAVAQQLDSIARPLQKNHRDLVMIFDDAEKTNVVCVASLSSAFKSKVPVLFNRAPMFQFALAELVKMGDCENWDIFADEFFVVMIPHEYKIKYKEVGLRVDHFQKISFQDLVNLEKDMPSIDDEGEIIQKVHSISGQEILHTVANLFDTDKNISWNFIMHGHGDRHLLQSCGLPIDACKNIIQFFKSNIEVNALLMLSCHVASADLRRKVFGDQKYDFHILNQGYMDTSTSLTFKKNNICGAISKYDEYFEILHNIDDRKCGWQVKLADQLNPYLTQRQNIFNYLSLRPKGEVDFVVPRKKYIENSLFGSVQDLENENKKLRKLLSKSSDLIERCVKINDDLIASNKWLFGSALTLAVGQIIYYFSKR